MQSGIRQAPWKTVELRARKFFLSSSLRLQAEIREGSSLQPNASGASGGDFDLAPGARAVHLLIVTQQPWRGRSRTELYLDALNHAALYSFTTKWGKIHEQKERKYASTGIVKLSRQANGTPKDGDTVKWDELRQRFDAYPQPPSEPISDLRAMLYLLAASDIQKPGDNFEFLVFEDHSIVRITLSASELVEVGSKFVLKTAAGSRKVRQPREALMVKAHSEIVAGSADNDKLQSGEFRQGMEIALDTSTRAPLMVWLSGIRIVGKVRFRLVELEQ